MKDRLTKEGNLVTTCVECGHKFTISADEIDRYLNELRLPLPKRCKKCLRLKHAGLLNLVSDIEVFR